MCPSNGCYLFALCLFSPLLLLFIVIIVLWSNRPSLTSFPSHRLPLQRKVTFSRPSNAIFALPKGLKLGPRWKKGPFTLTSFNQNNTKPVRRRRRRRRLRNVKKLVEKVVFPVFFFLSYSFSKRVQTCFVPTKWSLFCVVVAWYSRHVVVGCERESIAWFLFDLLPNNLQWRALY